MTIFINEAWNDLFPGIAFGAIEGHRRVTALGNNPDVDTGTIPEDVWSGGGPYPWMTAATSLEIVSTSANDAAAGTGARTVRMDFLDTTYAEFSTTITLNGLTPVAFPTAAFRINGGLILSAGSGKVNAGDLIIRDAGGGTTRAIIPAGYGIARQAIYTVPAGYTLNLGSQLFAINRSGGVSRYATFANYIQSPNGFYRITLEVSVSERQPYRHEGMGWLGITLPEKTDYAGRITNVTSDNTDVTLAFLGYLKSNTLVT